MKRGLLSKRCSHVFRGLAISVATLLVAMLLPNSANHVVSAGYRHQESSRLTLASAQPGLQNAFKHEIFGQSFGTVYGASGAKLLGNGVSLSVGLGTVGRSHSGLPIDGTFVRKQGIVAYGQAAIKETFKSTASGVEQSFIISRRPSGSGPLRIVVPISGLSATTNVVCSNTSKPTRQTLPGPPGLAAIFTKVRNSGNTSRPTCVNGDNSIDLRDAQGEIRATYSKLRATDFSGGSVPASMGVAAGGRSIVLEIHDTGIRYPITIDPTWTQTQELVAGSGTFDYFGWAVATSGSTAMIGDPSQNADRGVVYVFQQTDGTWSETQGLGDPDEEIYDAFGNSIAISGKTALIGAYSKTVDGNDGQGAAYIFTETDGSWSQSQELTASDGAINDYFGLSVAISGSTALVGATGHTVDGNDAQGAAYVFTNSDGSWSQSQELTASDGATDDYFGSSVALSGATALIAAPAHTVTGFDQHQGAVYVFTEAEGSWSQVQELTASDRTAGDGFGFSVAISGAMALIGARYHSDFGAGAAYVFTKTDGSWSQVQELTASDGATNDNFGYSVAISGSTALVGAIGHTVDGNDAQGAAYVFTDFDGTWLQSQELTASDGATGDFFGDSVAIAGSTLLVGAYDHTVYGDVDDGAVYVFGGPSIPVEAVGIGTGGGGGVTRHNTTCVRADPVNCGSGDFTESTTDVSVPGRGPELDLTRTYNSLEASMEGMFGYGWTSSYDSSLVVNDDESVTITAGDGSQVTAEPGDADNYVMPSWSDSTLTHNEDGTWTYVKDQTQTYTFNSSGELTTITDLNGYSETLSYTSGKLTTVTDASGRTLTFDYGENGLVSEVTDPAGQHTTYAYDDSDDLTSVTDPMSRVTSYTYDDSGDHLLLTIKYPNDQSGGPDAGDDMVNTYNDAGQVLTQTDRAGLETSFSYSGDNFSTSCGSTTITDPHGNVELEYYCGGELLSDTKGYGTANAETWTYSYDPSTLGETSVTDPSGNTTIDTYDEYGNLLTSTDALGNTTTYTYNSLNEPLTAVDPMGIETEYTYDDDGNLTSKEIVGTGGSPTETTDYSYDDGHAGDVTSVTDPDDDVTDYTYDAYGDLASETTNPGSSTIAEVQSGATNTDDGSIASGSSADILPSDPTPGDALVAAIYTFSGNDDDVTSVTGMGGVWHRGVTISNDDANDESGVIELWYALDVAGGSKSLTISGASGDWEAWVAEYSGVDPVNGFVTGISNFGSSDDPSVSVSGSSGDLAVVASSDVATFSSSPDSPWSAGDDSDDFNNTFGRTAEYRVLTASGSVTADWTGAASGDWGAIGIVLAPAHQAASGIRYVSDGSTQSGDDSYSSGQTVPILPEDSIPGDALVAVIYTFSGNTDDVSSISGLGGTWHRAASMAIDDSSDGYGDNEIWYALDISGGSKDITVDGATGGWVGWVGEYSGVDPTDGFVSAATNYGVSTAPDLSLGTVPAGDLAVSAGGTLGAFSSSPFSSWVEGDLKDDFNNDFGETSAYQIPTSSGSVSATWGSFTSNPWSTVGLVLAPVSGSRGGGDTTQFVYDVLGRKACEASPLATSAGVNCPEIGDPRVPGTSTWTYDDDSEVSSETDPDGNSTDYSYDADGNQTEVTDALGNVTRTTYDADDRESTVTQGYGTDAASETSYTYDVTPDECPIDPTGTTFCTETTNGLSDTTTDYYNSLDQIIEKTPPNTADETATTYTYDPSGNVEIKSDGAGVTTYSYDDDNRLVGISYSDAPAGMTTPHSVTYTYDDDGNRTEMVDGTGATTYDYNSLEEIVSVEDGDGKTVTYGYDSDGNEICLSYPNEDSHSCVDDDSGTGIVTYSYDSAGELDSMNDWLGATTDFAYDPGGNLTVTILPSSTTTIVNDAYDAAGTLTDTSVDTSGTTTELASLARNADDLIASATPSSGDTTTYGYNSLNQVTSGLGANYTYDTAGEITSVTPTGDSATDYSYNTDDQLCWAGSTSGSCDSPPDGSTTFSYDSAGDRTASTSSDGNPTTYGYDQAGNLVCDTVVNGSSYSCSDQNSSVTSTYEYNGDGLRMEATPADGSSEQFTWDTNASVPQILEDGPNFYLYGPTVGSAPIEQITVSDPTPSYLVSDTTGVRQQLDSSGDIAGSMSYSSYGVACGSCSISTPFGYEGEYTDPTGLIYMDHRYYDPGTAQFLSEDPAVDETLQPYAFTNGDPVNGSDPSGLCNDAQGVHVYDGPCTGSQLAGIEEAAAQARAAGVATACSGFFSCAADTLENHWKGAVMVVGVVAAATSVVLTLGADIPVIAAAATATEGLDAASIAAGATDFSITSGALVLNGVADTAGTIGNIAGILGTAGACVHPLGGGIDADCAWSAATTGLGFALSGFHGLTPAAIGFATSLPYNPLTWFSGSASGPSCDSLD
jgi:RHS repeat-associated protein